MQGQRSTFQPVCEAFDMDRPSSSSTSVMDQPLLWNELLPVSVENQDLPRNPMSSSGTVSCGNVASQEGPSFNFWDTIGPSSSMPPLNQGSHNEIKLEYSWMASSLGSRTGGPRIQDSRPEATNNLSFETDSGDLNINLANNRQQLSQLLALNESPHDSSHNTKHVEMSREVLGSGFHSGPSNVGLTPYQHVAFCASSSGGSSSRAIDFFSNNDGGKQKVTECSSHKRKNIERDHGECSASGNSGNFNEGVYRAEDNNTRGSIIPRAGASNHYHFVSSAGNHQRNTRMRMNHADEANTFAPDLWAQENNLAYYNPWHPQLASATIPHNQLSDSRYQGSNLVPHRQRHVCTMPVLPLDLYPFPHNGISTTEVGSSSGSPAVAADGASAELDSSGVSINISEQTSAPPISTRNMLHEQTNWGSVTGSTVLSGNLVPTSQVGTNLGVYQPLGANWLTHQNRRRISEAVCRSLLSSDCRGHSMDHSTCQNSSSASQEVGHQSGAVSRVHQHPYMRLSGALSVPLPTRTLAATREGRNRMSEIRNVFERLRRGENLLLEDVLLLEQSAFVGGGNFQDRYRDMRLDVDNMSYEELLALGERMGSVNTGLSEEKILSCLKQRKYISVATHLLAEVEPCCICREEYIEGEEVGRLDCSHDFHSACIKKWLMIKNICPICKTTALST
ncbi:probable E3 ubiquitin-protein ligase HIP1 isoform X1 [Zingiber officinale]|uniref:probable E3 ubiquitin-protein ligase HIP1 isoform X1 n=1 Tax=Zingiber officinale TaxID=94328 RepID=UPI001C4C1DDE|nr:probable E3 ubiquitin-protein ligase HIP1 isoform X1 [Zingiber officinale]